MTLMPEKRNNVYTLRDSSSESRDQALDRLYRAHSEPLRSFLLGRVRDSDELEDVVSEVFSRLASMPGLVESLPQGQERSNRSYIFTAANNCIVDLERRKAVRRIYRQTNQEADDSHSFELGPDVTVAAIQELDLVKAAIKKLKPRWRKAFLLNRFKYMSYKEISVEMKVSEKQIEYYITKSLAKLREVTSQVPHCGTRRKEWWR